jgi:hypothetical protein
VRSRDGLAVDQHEQPCHTIAGVKRALEDKPVDQRPAACFLEALMGGRLIGTRDRDLPNHAVLDRPSQEARRSAPCLGARGEPLVDMALHAVGELEVLATHPFNERDRLADLQPRVED